MNSKQTSDHIGRLTKTLYLCGLALSLVIVLFYMIHPSFVRSINNKVTDFIIDLQHTNRPATESVTIVDIDDNSLAKYGQWPWPRYRLSKLIQGVNGNGAASIGLDMILAEPDRTSPDNLQSAIARELGYKIHISGLPPEMADNDQHLAKTISKCPFVLGYEFLFSGEAKENRSSGLHPVNAIWITNNNSGAGKSDFFTARDVVSNQNIFSASVSYSGFLNATPDSDGILRRVPLLIRYEGQVFPSFALASILQSEKIKQIKIMQQKNAVLDIVVGGKVIPMDKQGNVTINFPSLSKAVPTVSAADLLDGKVFVNLIKGKIVIVGSSAAGLGKIYQTPALMVQSDVELHARLLEYLLSGRLIVRSDDFIPWEALFGLLMALLVCISVVKMELLGSSLTAAFSIIGSWTGTILVFQTDGRLLSPFLPTFVVLICFTSLAVLKSWKYHQHSKAMANEAFFLLKSSEDNLNSIIKSVPDIIFRLDSSGRITFISPAISKYADSPDALIGHSIFELVVPDDLDKVRYRINEKRTGSRATRGLEVRLLLPHQGETKEEIGYFSVSAEGIYNGDTPSPEGFIGTQGIIRDITEQKKLEEKLLHAQKMEAVGNLAAGVAHDLNNILSGLVGYPELILLELPKNSALRKDVAAIQKSAMNAAAIVQDLLTLARRGVKISEVVNLNNIIADYLASPEHASAWRNYPNIRIETRLDADLMNILGSKVHFSKVIMNILNNAAEAMPTGGTIHLASYNRFLDTPENLFEPLPAGEYVCVSVSDEGVGIAIEDLHRIFEPFYTKKAMKRSGSGLGMTIIWATIKDYNGFIDLRSIEGEGTQIILYLPATRENEGADSQRIPLEDYLGTEHILVVDDMLEQINIATKMLTKLGYKVTSAASGEKAIELIKQDKPDLVLLDMIMPGGMDGLDTYRRIIEINPTQRVVITSGYSESDRVRMAQQLGAGSYVHKPCTMEKLGITIRRELDRS